MADGKANGSSSPANPTPRVLFLTFASLRAHPDQDVYARGLARMLAHDMNRAQPGVAAAALLTARRGDVKGFVLPQVPGEPGPMVALGQQLNVPWIVQGFSRVTAADVDLQVQWVNAEKMQVSAVTRFSGTRAELGKVLDQVRKAAATAFGVPDAPSMPPPVWHQTKSAEAFHAFLRYLDNATLLYDPADRDVVGELRDPVDYLKEALRQDRAFRIAADMLAAENRGEVGAFGPVLEIAVDDSALL